MSSNGIVCIIPARKGSKRLPGKNKLLLAGKNLISYTIEAALDSGIFSGIFVSTDDADIAGIAREYNVHSIDRSEALAGDRVTAAKVVADHLTSQPGLKNAQHIAVLYPTCPFRSAEDIKEAWALYEQWEKKAFVVSVNSYDFPPQYALVKEEAGAMRMTDPKVYEQSTQSQSVQRYVHPNGAIYLFSRDAFMSSQSFYGSPLVGYEMPAERSLDIDHPHQFEYAEFLMNKK